MATMLKSNLLNSVSHIYSVYSVSLFSYLA